MRQHQRRTEALPGLSEFLRRQGLGITAAAAQAGIHFTSLHKILRGAQQPTLSTLNAILDFARRYDPHVTFEQLFAEELPEQASQTAQVAGAAAGSGRHG